MVSAPGGCSAEQVESLQGSSLNAELAAGSWVTNVHGFKYLSAPKFITNAMNSVKVIGAHRKCALGASQAESLVLLIPLLETQTHTRGTINTLLLENMLL